MEAQDVQPESGHKGKKIMSRTSAYAIKSLSCSHNQNRMTMIEKDGKLWYSQQEAADFLSSTWRTMTAIKRRVDSLVVCKIANQNYYEFESIARYNQERQKPTRRRDLALWKHPELKNHELISDEVLARDYYSTKEARRTLKLDYGTYERFYTTMTNNSIGSFQSGRRIFWSRRDVDALKERLDSSVEVTDQKLSELRQKVADLSRKNEALTKENVLLQYKLDVSEKERAEYRNKYMGNKEVEKVKNEELSRSAARLSHLMEFSGSFLEMTLAIMGFKLNNQEKNVLRLYFHGMDFNEIARRRHSDSDTVRNMLYRALEKVEECLKRISKAKDTLSIMQQVIEEK